MAAGAGAASCSAEMPAAAAAAAQLRSLLWGLALPQSSTLPPTTRTQTAAAASFSSDGSRTLQPQQRVPEAGGRRCDAGAAGEQDAAAVACGGFTGGSGDKPAAAEAFGCLITAAASRPTLQLAAANRRLDTAGAKLEPSLGATAAAAAEEAVIGSRGMHALLTTTRRRPREVAEASAGDTFSTTAAAIAGAAAAASAGLRQCPQEQQLQQQQPWSSTTPTAPLLNPKGCVSAALKTHCASSCKSGCALGGSGGSRQPTSLLQSSSLLLLLLLLAQQLSTWQGPLDTPADCCSSSCSSGSPVGPMLLLLPVGALPLPRRSSGRGSSAASSSSSSSSLAAPPLPLHVGSLAFPGATAAAGAAAAPFVRSSSLAEGPSGGSRQSGGSAERRGSNSNTALAFVSSAHGALRVWGGADAAAQRQQQQQRQQLLLTSQAATPLRSRATLREGSRLHGKGGIPSLQKPLLPELHAAWPSVSFSGSSRMHSSSDQMTKTAAQQQQAGGTRNLGSNSLFISTVGAAGLRGAPTTAAAAASEEKGGSRLVGSVKEVIMPALSSTMKEGRIVSWMKQIGDRVQVGDVLMVVESDKADMDVEALDDGFMAYQAVAEGVSAPVGSTVALIAEQLDDLPLIEQRGVGLLSGDEAAAAAAGEGEAAAATATAASQPAAAAGDAFGDATAAASGGEKQQISELVLPALGPSTGAGHIAMWKKKEGDTVRHGEVLFIVESDKADMDVEAPHDGVLARILVERGVKVPVGTAVGLLARDAAGAAAAAASASPLLQQQQPRVSAAGRMPEGTREVFLQIESPAALVSARIIKWLRRVGDYVKRGEKLLVVEGDNGERMEIGSADEGYLAATRVDEQQQAAAGETVALLVTSAADVATVQQLLRQTLPLPPAEADMGGGAVVEYSSFPDKKKEAAASLATWASPSVDQDISAQLPPGLTSEDLEKEFLRRLQQRLHPDVAAKVRSPQGAEYLKRLSLRVPPPHTLRDTNGSPGAAPGAIAAADAPHRRRREEELKHHAADRQVEGASAAAAQMKQKTKDGQERKDTSSVYDPAGNPLATTHAASLAMKHKLNLEEVRGTGTHARVTLADVQRHLGLPAEETEVVIRSSSSSIVNNSNSNRSTVKDSNSGSSYSPAFMRTPLPVGAEKMDSMQKAVARNMEATLGVPVFKVSRGIYVDKLEALLQELKQIISDGNDRAAAKGEQQQQPPVTMTVLLAKAVALTITKHPLLNASYEEKDGGQIRHPGSADLAIAVSLEGGGLVTPVLREAEKKDLFSLAKEWSVLTEKAKQKRLTPADLTGGTFYISNLGMFGVQQFDAVLPRGVGCIMAVGATETLHQQQHGKTAAAAAAGAGPAAGQSSRRMTVTLTCDHRHIYGTHAALFLKDLSTLLETRPSELLVQ